MGVCKAKEYTDNFVVLQSALPCHGGGKAYPAYKPCAHLKDCMGQYGFKLSVTKKGVRRWLRIKGFKASPLTSSEATSER